jgi:hypothetical protein
MKPIKTKTESRILSALAYLIEKQKLTGEQVKDLILEVQAQIES